MLSTAPDARLGTRPVGIYDRLLCKECEVQISRYEQYAREVFHRETLGVLEEPSRVVLTGINYTKFKLFQMSLLWRASITKRHEFAGVDLGSHGERMRRMILKEDPGEPYEYGCTLFSRHSSMM